LPCPHHKPAPPPEQVKKLRDGGAVTPPWARSCDGLAGEGRGPYLASAGWAPGPKLPEEVFREGTKKLEACCSWASGLRDRVAPPVK
jgi:hypothetical protein